MVEHIRNRVGAFKQDTSYLTLMLLTRLLRKSYYITEILHVRSEFRKAINDPEALYNIARTLLWGILRELNNPRALYDDYIDTIYMTAKPTSIPVFLKDDIREFTVYFFEDKNKLYGVDYEKLLLDIEDKLLVERFRSEDNLKLVSELTSTYEIFVDNKEVLEMYLASLKILTTGYRLLEMTQHVSKMYLYKLVIISYNKVRKISQLPK